MTGTPEPIVDDRGDGGPILVVHGGMSDESPWRRVSDTLAQHHRVILLRRRLYRLELPVVEVQTVIADQVTEIVRVAQGLGRPCVIFGHSSGAILALEALTVRPDLFVGGVCYEPPSPLDGLPLGEPSTVTRARAALADRRTGRALQIFLRESVRVPAAASAVAPALALLPAVRRYVARQIDDLDAIVRLGVRSPAYRRIDRPVWFLTGQKSPAHLRQRCVRLAAALPRAQLVNLPGTGHGAHQTHPRQLAELIGDFADRLLSR